MTVEEPAGTAPPLREFSGEEGSHGIISLTIFRRHTKNVSCPVSKTKALCIRMHTQVIPPKRGTKKYFLLAGQHCSGGTEGCVVGTPRGCLNTADTCLPYNTSVSHGFLLCGFSVFVFYSTIYKKRIKCLRNSGHVSAVGICWKGPQDAGQRRWEPGSQDSASVKLLY